MKKKIFFVVTLLIFFAFVFVVTGKYYQQYIGMPRMFTMRFMNSIEDPTHLRYLNKKSLFEKKLINVNTGDTVNFEEYKDKSVFINYWFTSCAACIEEFSDIEEFYKKKGTIFPFFIISHESPEKVNAFLKKKKYQLPFFCLVDRTFPADIQNTCPMSYFFLNGTPIFRYVGRGYYDSNQFYNFLDAKIVAQK